MDQEADPGDHHQHDRGERVDQEADVRLEGSRLDPGEDGLLEVPLLARQAQQLDQAAAGDDEGAENRAGSDPTDDLFILYLLAE